MISDKDTQNQHRLVTIPYVVKAKQKIIDSLNVGIPVYIVGNLESGKTQLPTEAAWDFSIQNKKQRELEGKMENWFSENPTATEINAIGKLENLMKKERFIIKIFLGQGTCPLVPMSPCPPGSWLRLN